MSKFEIAISKIDEYNKKDPNIVLDKGKQFQKEYLDSLRQSTWLAKLNPYASEELKIAARSQHIGRWEIPRNLYPETRTGYLTWRSDLAKFHAETTAGILKVVGYEPECIEKVKNLNLKKSIKLDPEAQMLEDVLCLVFLEFHISDFHVQHSREKVINIIQKTWKKMGIQGREFALKLNYKPEVLSILSEALEL
ncbi:MAG: DUF4202 domain-containing protein [Opitutaceae bacterium]|nr:DUF4202 domain-containing protein [Cytophagales bacterium]